MSLPTLLETARKLTVSPLVLDIQFLGTKVRAHLPKGYILDIYYNATQQKYSYTIIKQNNSEKLRKLERHTQIGFDYVKV